MGRCPLDLGLGLLQAMEFRIEQAEPTPGGG
jgi:hypothetical protein